MSKRNNVVAIASIATLALALSGCGTNLTGAHEGGEAVVYWGKWAEGTPQAVLFEEVIADYTEETGTEIDVQWLGNGQEDQVKNAIATGEGPDFFDTAIDHTPGFRAAGAIGDIDALLDAEIPGEGVPIRDVLPANVLEVISDDEGPGFVPHSLFSIGLWYDAGTFPEFTEAPPATFDDFLEIVADRQAETGAAPIALDGTINAYNAYWLYQLLLSTAGPGILVDLASDPTAWDRPEVLRAVAELERLVQLAPFQKDYMATKFPDAQNAWAAGDHDFNLNGTWLGSETAPMRADGADPRVAAFPPVEQGAAAPATVGALGWAVSPSSKHQEEVADFLAFAMQKKYIDRIATDADNIPARADSPAPAALEAAQAAIIDAPAVSLDFDGIAMVNPEWWNDVFLPLDDKLIGGSITGAEFIAAGRAQTEAMLSR
ncbi:ABC transporter substrate-binding protein [Agromyces mediolanus]|uniref:ABC transporter substrate-binding protein n=1 Tax=Agromyces mediolanus TaxID=41986 RepID=UPI001E463678|nr:extracellular solute-binding protein [Agromyces mediolanus]MCD1570567.1 extracellular solute-binding protein [Agromyces mediolanus]